MVPKDSLPSEPKGLLGFYKAILEDPQGFWIFATVVTVVLWLEVTIVPRSWNGLGSGRSPLLTAITAIGAFVIVVIPGLWLVTRKGQSVGRMIGILVFIASTLVSLYATYYYYLGVPGNFSKKLVSRPDSAEMALGYLTNTDVAGIKPVSQSAKILVLSQSVIDIVFIVVILALALGWLVDAHKGEKTESVEAPAESPA
jgi:hypothetical protein